MSTKSIQRNAGWLIRPVLSGSRTSTHLSGFLVEAFAVVALAVAPRHQTAGVRVVTQAAATVAGPWRRVRQEAQCDRAALVGGKRSIRVWVAYAPNM